MDTIEKLAILTDAAKFDVACTSSGVDRDAQLGRLGTTTCAGICHSFAADGRCITLLKVLQTNVCVYDCSYCVNRRSNDIPRAAFQPRELAELTMGFYRRNYIEGLFVSSGVIGSPDRSMELMLETVRILRDELGFNGYIHAKAIPGASPELITRMGLLVDRMSVNVELPSQRSLDLLAPDKSPYSVLEPMGLIAQGIQCNQQERALSRRLRERFAPAGQSTQLIVGASPEDDYQILSLSAALYRRFELKRVFYSAYLPVNDDPLLPDKGCLAPLDREHRLYQADWLTRFYGFEVEELISPQDPWLDTLLDPKAGWALAHLDQFPVEINRAPYEMLLRVPGLGVTGAKRICQARRQRTLRPESLRKLGLSLKRMQYFITCDGSYKAPLPFDGELIRKQLQKEGSKANKAARGGDKRPLDGQLSLIDSGDEGRQRAFAAPEARLQRLEAARPRLEAARSQLEAARRSEAS